MRVYGPYSACALFHRLGQEPLARGHQGRLVNYRDGSLLPFQYQSQISNRLGDVFFELRCCLTDEGFVLWLGLGNPHFYMRYAIYPILKGMGQHNLRRARDWKKGAHGKVVEGTPIEHFFDDGVLSVHAVILGTYSLAPVARVLDDRVSGPPFLPLPGHCEMFPHRLSRRGDIKIPGHVGLGRRYLDARALVLLLPRVFEVAQPELNVANDVDGFVMLDESLRRRFDAHGLGAGVAVKRIGAAANLLAHRVLEEPVDENHIASRKLFASAHLLLHHLAVMDDELEIKIAHRNAGFALADR